MSRMYPHLRANLCVCAVLLILCRGGHTDEICFKCVGSLGNSSLPAGWSTSGGDQSAVATRATSAPPAEEPSNARSTTAPPPDVPGDARAKITLRTRRRRGLGIAQTTTAPDEASSAALTSAPPTEDLGGSLRATQPTPEDASATTPRHIDGESSTRAPEEELSGFARFVLVIATFFKVIKYAKYALAGLMFSVFCAMCCVWFIVSCWRRWRKRRKTNAREAADEEVVERPREGAERQGEERVLLSSWDTATTSPLQSQPPEATVLELMRKNPKKHCIDVSDYFTSDSTADTGGF